MKKQTNKTTTPESRLGVTKRNGSIIYYGLFIWKTESKAKLFRMKKNVLFWRCYWRNKSYGLRAKQQQYSLKLFFLSLNLVGLVRCICSPVPYSLKIYTQPPATNNRSIWLKRTWKHTHVHRYKMYNNIIVS